MQIEATIPDNFVYALGTDDQIYGELASAGRRRTPGVTGWHLVG